METKIIEKSCGVNKKIKKGKVIEINLVEDIETFVSIKFSDKIWNNIKEYMFIIEYMDDKLNTNIISAPKQIITEDLGKIFEMAICLSYEIEYNGKYKYSLEEADIIKERIYKLKDVFPYKIKHIAKNGNKYDFVSLENEDIHLSAKTTKKDGKVCPQVIGQPSKKKFCEFFGLDLQYNLEQIKQYIQDNINALLNIYTLNTFDCPVIYYNKHKNLLLFVKLKENINWTNFDITFSHVIKNKKWIESSSIIINNNNTIGEFQIHNHRDCIKFRWSFEKILNLFKDNFEIIYL
jgi:hypothetical protein